MTVTLVRERPSTNRLKVVPTIRQVLLSEWRKMPQAVLTYPPLTSAKTGAPTSRAVRHAVRLLVPRAGQAVSERGPLLDDNDVSTLRAELAATQPILERTVEWHRAVTTAYRERVEQSGIEPFRDKDASFLEIAVGLAMKRPDQIDQQARIEQARERLEGPFSNPNMNRAVRRALDDVEVRERVQSTLDEVWRAERGEPMPVERALKSTAYRRAVDILNESSARPRPTMSAAAEAAWQDLVEHWPTLPELRANELFLSADVAPAQPALRRTPNSESGTDEAPASLPLQLSIEGRVLKAIHGAQVAIAPTWTAESMLHSEAEASAQRGGVRSRDAQVAVLVAGLLARMVMSAQFESSIDRPQKEGSAISEAHRLGRRARRAIDELSGASRASRALALIVYEPGAYVMYRAWIRIHQTEYREGTPPEPIAYWTEICDGMSSSSAEATRILKEAPVDRVGETIESPDDHSVAGYGRDGTLRLLERFAEHEWGHADLKEFRSWCLHDSSDDNGAARREQWEMLCLVVIDRIGQLIEHGEVDGLPRLTINDLPTLHQIRLHIRNGAWGLGQGTGSGTTPHEGDAS